MSFRRRCSPRPNPESTVADAMLATEDAVVVAADVADAARQKNEPATRKPRSMLVRSSSGMILEGKQSLRQARGMDSDDDRLRFDPEDFRDYLVFLARLWLPRRLQRKLDASDLVQVALTKAFEKAQQFRGENGAQYKAWLRQILRNTLLDALKKYDRFPEESIRSLEESSGRLENQLVDMGLEPGKHAMLQEDMERMADLLAELPDDQQDALVMKHCLGWKVADIADELGRTTASVAGLLRRGLKHLRSSFSEE